MPLKYTAFALNANQPIPDAFFPFYYILIGFSLIPLIIAARSILDTWSYRGGSPAAVTHCLGFTWQGRLTPGSKSPCDPVRKSDNTTIHPTTNLSLVDYQIRRR